MAHFSDDLRRESRPRIERGARSEVGPEMGQLVMPAAVSTSQCSRRLALRVMIRLDVCCVC